MISYYRCIALWSLPSWFAVFIITLMYQYSIYLNSLSFPKLIQFIFMSCCWFRSRNGLSSIEFFIFELEPHLKSHENNYNIRLCLNNEETHLTKLLMIHWKLDKIDIHTSNLYHYLLSNGMSAQCVRYIELKTFVLYILHLCMIVIHQIFLMIHMHI